MIELTNVGVQYPTKTKPFHALRGVTLTAYQGQMMGIIGPSGAGKSTLLRTINMLERPSSGEVRVQGVLMNSLSQRELSKARRSIGIIFQHFHLLQTMRVEDNVALALRYSSLSYEQKKKKIHALLDRVGLLEKAKNYPACLSGGQKQRVAIARALSTDPSILLCDEATSALDPETSEQILKLIESLHQERNMTTVLVTHQMEIVKRHCTSMAIMLEGQLRSAGKWTDLISDPLHPQSARFLHKATTYEQTKKDIMQHAHQLGASENTTLMYLRFVGEVTHRPILSKLTQLGITTNILSGEIEFLKQDLMGSLWLLADGSNKNKEQMYQLLRREGVYYETTPLERRSS